jgi:polysaccharide export outer membrane protein
VEDAASEGGRAGGPDAMRALTLLLVAAATSVLAQDASRRPAAPQPTPAAPAASPAGTYAIGPADVLRIAVWKEPDLNVEATVRTDGMVSFPLLGDVKAGGVTPDALANTLGKRLERFVEAPKVTVSVLQANSARFYVLGQVSKPGEFPLGSRSTVLQALALAGGFKEFAKPESIVIVREDQTVVPVNYKRIAEGKDVSQNVVLQRGDTIVVP